MDANRDDRSPGAALQHLPVRDAWLRLALREPVLEPDLPIIDPHHHLWDRAGSRYLLDELLEDLQSGHRVLASAFVQCRAMYRSDGPEHLRPLGEVDFVVGVAEQCAREAPGGARVCEAIVAGADLCGGDALAATLDAFEARAAGRLRGMRNASAWHPDPAVRLSAVRPPPGLLGSSPFVAGARRLGARGLVLDVWVYHNQIADVDALADRCPDTTIVLDHVGGPLGVGPYAGRRDEVFAEWRAAMAALAAHPNVRVKLGGLAMRTGGYDFHERARPPSSVALADAWRPWIETAIERFGVERCMFESNFPVSKAMCDYRTLWNAFKRITSGASRAERERLFAGTAAEVYRIALASGAVMPGNPC